MKKNNNTISLIKKIITLTSLLGISAIIFFALNGFYHQQWMEVVAVVMLTTFYHFAMRISVGEIITVKFKNKTFPEDRMGFKMFAFEDGLYQKLKVKRWKMGVITAKPELFDIRQVSPEELLHNVMQAELVHRIIMVLSFVPLLLIIPFGSPAVFILTSVLACLFDAIFVIIQRYNRPRVKRYLVLANKKKKIRK